MNQIEPKKNHWTWCFQNVVNYNKRKRVAFFGYFQDQFESYGPALSACVLKILLFEKILRLQPRTCWANRLENYMECCYVNISKIHDDKFIFQNFEKKSKNTRKYVDSREPINYFILNRRSVAWLFIGHLFLSKLLIIFRHHYRA